MQLDITPVDKRLLLCATPCNLRQSNADAPRERLEHQPLRVTTYSIIYVSTTKRKNNWNEYHGGNYVGGDSIRVISL